jgi:hypothetical protein
MKNSGQSAVTPARRHFGNNAGNSSGTNAETFCDAHPGRPNGRYAPQTASSPDDRHPDGLSVSDHPVGSPIPMLEIEIAIGSIVEKTF